MKTYRKEGNRTLTWIVVILFLVSGVFMARTAMADGISALSYDSPPMTAFNKTFKQYMKSTKKKQVSESLEQIASAISQWDAMVANISSPDNELKSHLTAVKAWLLMSQSKALHNQFSEARKLTIPIRSEIYRLHKHLKILTVEDHINYFHNGVIHKAEPLVMAGKFLNLEMMIPFMEASAAKLQTPPKHVTQREEYQKKYEKFLAACEKYYKAVKKANTDVDPEFNTPLLIRKLDRSLHAVHKAFGGVYNCP